LPAWSFSSWTSLNVGRKNGGVQGGSNSAEKMENKDPPDALSADMSDTPPAVSALALRQRAEAT
jgi:hypothetical protein